MTCKWVAGYSVVEIKGGLIRHLWSRGRDWCLCFESTAGKTKCIYEKWQRSQGCTRRLTKALPCPWEEIRKSRPQKRTNQFSGFVTMPSEEKKDHTLHIFWYQRRERIWKNIIISGENDKAKPPEQSKEDIRRCQLFIVPKTTLLLWDRGGFRLNLNLCTRCCSWLALLLCLQRSMPPMFCHS